MSRQMARRPPPHGPYAPKSTWDAAVGYVLNYGVLMPLSAPALLAENVRLSVQKWQNDHTEDAIEYRKRKAENERKEALFRQQRDAERPQALPKTRPRSLSLTLPNPEAKLEQISSRSTLDSGAQSTCLLLTKLPANVRGTIWELVVGGNVIQIFRGHVRLLHHVQDAERAEPEYSSGMPNFYAQTKRTNLLALLKTCRQM
jgi:hypothetical protein